MSRGRPDGRHDDVRLVPEPPSLLVGEAGLEDGLKLRRQRRLLGAARSLARIIAVGAGLGPSPLAGPVRIFGGIVSGGIGRRGSAPARGVTGMQSTTAKPMAPSDFSVEHDRPPLLSPRGLSPCSLRALCHGVSPRTAGFQGGRSIRLADSAGKAHPARLEHDAIGSHQERRCIPGRKGRLHENLRNLCNRFVERCSASPMARRPSRPRSCSSKATSSVTPRRIRPGRSAC